jgi:hypothetical protein
MTFKNIKLKNFCYLFLIFKEVIGKVTQFNPATKAYDLVNFVCSHTKIVEIIYNLLKIIHLCFYLSFF